MRDQEFETFFEISSDLRNIRRRIASFFSPIYCSLPITEEVRQCERLLEKAAELLQDYQEIIERKRAKN